jgi:putative transcriptional regulator
MTYVSQNPDTLAGNLLVAMPSMPDPRFARSVIYLCAHGEEGSMGLVVNRVMDELSFHELLGQLDIDVPGILPPMRVRFGGPVEQGRGFVLHSTDFVREGSLMVDDDVALTATVDILRAIAEGRGPRHRLFALGYAGWGPGQLDAEIQANGWLHAPADPSLLFDDDLDTKWERAIAKIGANPLWLSGEAGHA